MDAQARSAGVSSCSGSQHVQDSRCFRARLGSCSHHVRTRTVRCFAAVRAKDTYKKRQVDSRCQEHSRLVERRSVDVTTLAALDDDLEPSSRNATLIPLALVSGVAALSIVALLLPGEASAAEVVPLDLFSQFLDKVQELGPWGPALFIATVIGCEMIPLFPTQPLALSSGLLFGPYVGAASTIFATTVAASIAYSFSKGLGRKFAQQMIDSEIGDSKGNAAKRALNKVQQSVEKGSFWQQYSAVLALRLTPVVPFSASSYLLGLSSLPFKPFFAGTFSAMAFWGPLYATIGAASRAVLNNGGNVGELLSDLQARTGQYSEKVAVVSLAAGLATLGLWAAGIIKGPSLSGTDD